ncbi:MAG: deoxyguanosinetriphosphate triphosphohydrolase [Actinomycetaceae bacterium]|nr:deoxyguanosinetriphosphate triphosphohydrolase [Actinomycetaceae bacterium]
MSALPIPPPFRYSDADRQRFVPEHKKSGNRTDFERDRARILHSAAFRRLGAKTQVMGPSSDDFIRTRLTHSLEVAQVGREIGKLLGADPDVVDTACLAHDLGHPPFGHNGERALDALATECGGFEGNAQTFRLLVDLEPKVSGKHGEARGVNLTRASLDAVCKYPWTRGKGPDREKSQVKYSVYAEDIEIFNWMRAEDRAGRRCLEAQIMDLSDDIGYSVHDIEDAMATGRMNPRDLFDDAAFARIVEDTVSWYGSAINGDQLQRARENLLATDYWLTEFDGSYSARARLKDMTSQLIGRFATSVVNATLPDKRRGGLGRYAADLVIPADTDAEILLLKGLAVHYVMAPREIEPVYLQQRTLLADLVDALMESKGEHLEEPFRSHWYSDTSDATRLRAVIDQVASLTDTSASQWHARLCGLFSETF